MRKRQAWVDSSGRPWVAFYRSPTVENEIIAVLDPGTEKIYQRHGWTRVTLERAAHPKGGIR